MSDAGVQLPKSLKVVTAHLSLDVLPVVEFQKWRNTLPQLLYDFNEVYKESKDLEISLRHQVSLLRSHISKARPLKFVELNRSE